MVFCWTSWGYKIEGPRIWFPIALFGLRGVHIGFQIRELAGGSKAFCYPCQPPNPSTKLLEQPL